MELSCRCLNVQLRLPVGAEEVEGGLSDAAAEAAETRKGDAFFALPGLRLIRWDRSEGNLAEGRTFPVFVANRSVASPPLVWDVLRCLLCDTDLWASPLRPQESTNLILLNPTLPEGGAAAALRRSDDFSPALGIRVLVGEEGSGGVGGDVEWWSSPTAAAVQSRVSEYLRGEQEAMEARVRNYADAEHRRFELLRQETRRQRDTVLREMAAKGHLHLSAPEDRRLRNPSGGEDSAVPLSPVSLASLNETSQAQAISEVRPSKESPLVGSEDSGLGGASSTREEEGGMEEPFFPLDEDALLPAFKLHPPPLQLPQRCLADDEAESESDDSGTGAGVLDRRILLNPSAAEPLGKESGVEAAPRKISQGAGRLVPACGKSLPVRVPSRFWPPPDAVASAAASSSEEEEAVEMRAMEGDAAKGATNHHPQLHVREAHMAESMRKLARSIQPVDDPERIFGERPQRRRYKTTAQQPGNVVRQRHSGRQHLQAFPAPPRPNLN